MRRALRLLVTIAVFNFPPKLSKSFFPVSGRPQIFILKVILNRSDVITVKIYY